MISKSQQRRFAIQRQTQCHECQIKSGAVEPNDSLNGVTCIRGICPGCGEEDFLIYACDYNWPKTGEMAVYD